MNDVQKQSFTLNRYTLENGHSISVTLGYETYGELNEEKSNVILIAHFFSASSHAAGKYGPEDTIPGYWDDLIGPGKAIDTNKYFVISTDNLANVQWKNPTVITTGPRSINPETGKRWGMSFPAFTFRDMAGIQHTFLTEQLGIHKLHAVMGASAGGFISLHWAVQYPEMVERVIGVITNPQNPTITSFNVLQHAMRTIALDPNWKDGNYEEDREPTEGLYLAIQMMNVGAFSPEFYEEMYKRDSSEQEPYNHLHVKTAYEERLYNTIKATSSFIDASHWYYTCRATMMHDIAHNEGSLEAALHKIQAKVLMISCTSDLLQPTVFNRQMIQTMKKCGKEAELFEFDSLKGHMGGVLDTHLFKNQVTTFLDR
ncbi:alpha/beta fold hydrolase [Bacillus massiliigorillae]|uniref:alpha/beta fold hydrolase n=1 Tax=Bacillus massiliigorillae TaxID=1243664 RepID=UPI0005A6D00C|nr:homoserine O-acetyltransferase [Bacillus massiliigorillae]